MHSIVLAKIISPGNFVHSIEPQKQIFDILSQNVNHKVTKCYNVGLSDCSKIGVYNTSLNDGNPGGIKLQFNTHSQGDFVNAIALDSLEFNNKVSLIKIDCESEEVNVLKGAINLIKRDKPTIICEIAGGLSRDDPFTLNQLEQINYFLQDINYNIEKISFHDYLMKAKT